MAMPEFTLRQLLEAGVHFGHHTRRWNPAMAPYLFGVRNQVHIIDLQQTVPMLDRALRALRDTTANGGRVLFVGTKRAAAEPAMVHVILTAALGRIGDMLGRGALGADEQHAAAGGGDVANRLQGAFQRRHGLLQVDDMHLVAHAEQERRHARVPTAGVVTKVNAGLEQAAQRNIR